VELRTRDGIFIFDCGTGFRLLGNHLRKEFGGVPLRARIFLSHYHWDHIQGIPFFVPLYNRANSFIFHSFRSIHTDVQQALEDQMMNPYFPVEMGVMQAQRQFSIIAEGTSTYDGLTVSGRLLNHPQGCLGYRIEHKGKIVVYATDNEPGDARGDQNVRALAQDADIFIYDSQYTPHEYRKFKKNWGHSTWQEAINIAREAKVKKVVLFHHDPEHDDKQIDSIQRQARQRFPNCVAAREGLTINLR